MRSASDVADADDLRRHVLLKFHLHCSCLLLYEHGVACKAINLLWCILAGRKFIYK